MLLVTILRIKILSTFVALSELERSMIKNNRQQQSLHRYYEHVLIIHYCITCLIFPEVFFVGKSLHIVAIEG